MFSTDFIFRQQENLVDNQKCQAGFRPLCNKILLFTAYIETLIMTLDFLRSQLFLRTANKEEKVRKCM